jgi:hypothetical protein
MIYFSLPDDNTTKIKENSLTLLSKNRGNKDTSGKSHNYRYTTIISINPEVLKEYFKLDKKRYLQVKHYDSNNLPFKFELIDHEQDYYKNKF